MRQSIEDKPLLSPATRAYEAIFPSVVRVVGLMTEGDDGSDEKEHGVVERGVGTGVVIIDNGTILTNLHVVSRREEDPGHLLRRLGVRSRHRQRPSRRTTSRCCRRKTIPDDLVAATMRSTADLAPGDQVIAVGFPFGIGPSVVGGRRLRA